MVDRQTVCCMCGDVGFSDKLFRCSKCYNRFQHSYCSNYYGDDVTEATQQCDWCQSEKRSSSSSHAVRHDSSLKQQQSSEDKIRRLPVDGSEAALTAEKGKSPSPRPTTRRYKLLKDVMC